MHNTFNLPSSTATLSQLLTQTGLVSETERTIQRIIAGSPGVRQGGCWRIVDGATCGHQLVQSVIVCLQCTHFILWLQTDRWERIKGNCTHMCIHNHMCIHTHAHTHTHIRIHTLARARTHTQTHTHTLTHTHSFRIQTKGKLKTPIPKRRKGQLNYNKLRSIARLRTERKLETLISSHRKVRNKLESEKQGRTLKTLKNKRFWLSKTNAWTYAVKPT